ncbi:MAG: glycosyltransferase [Niabella sp.]
MVCCPERNKTRHNHFPAAEGNKLSLQDNIRLNPSTDAIASKYVESACFVLTSEYEGFTMVLTEAMIAGLPVTSFTCPCGPRHIINDGVDGLLVENGNVKELAEKICTIIEKEPMRIEMGKAATFCFNQSIKYKGP